MDKRIPEKAPQIFQTHQPRVTWREKSLSLMRKVFRRPVNWVAIASLAALLTAFTGASAFVASLVTPQKLPIVYFTAEPPQLQLRSIPTKNSQRDAIILDKRDILEGDSTFIEERDHDLFMDPTLVIQPGRTRASSSEPATIQVVIANSNLNQGRLDGMVQFSLKRDMTANFPGSDTRYGVDIKEDTRVRWPVVKLAPGESHSSEIFLGASKIGNYSVITTLKAWPEGDPERATTRQAETTVTVSEPTVDFPLNELITFEIIQELQAVQATFIDTMRGETRVLAWREGEPFFRLKHPISSMLITAAPYHIDILTEEGS
jgi:hypothetical protein